MAEPKTGVARWNESEGINPRKRRTANDKKRRIGFLIALCCALVASIALIMPIGEIINRGLYFKGGSQVTLTVTDEAGEKTSSDAIYQAASKISKRLSLAGVPESSVSSEENQIVIKVPEGIDAESTVAAVGGNGNFEFVVVDEIGDADALERVSSGAVNVKLEDGTYQSFMDSSHIKRITPNLVGEGYYYLNIEFTDEANIFEEKTAELAEQGDGAIAIVLDGYVITRASVSEEVTGGGVSVMCQCTDVQAQGYVAVVETGKLGVKTDMGESTEIGPLLGDNINYIALGIVCALIVAIFIVAYMRFHKLAVVVAGTPLVYTIILLGIMGIASRANMFTLTIPGLVAAVIAGVAATVASWMMVSYFVNHVNDGGTVKGASHECGREGLKPFIWPTVIYFVVGSIIVFFPQQGLKDFGQLAVFGVLAGLAGVLWYGLTMLRIQVADGVGDHPEAYGLKTRQSEA